VAIQLVIPSIDSIRTAQSLVLSCESCDPGAAEFPFDWILDDVTGLNGSTADYLMPEPARCPRCGAPVFEKTLVERNVGLG
jgi:hypothetical protein